MKNRTVVKEITSSRCCQNYGLVYSIFLVRFILRCSVWCFLGDGFGRWRYRGHVLCAITELSGCGCEFTVYEESLPSLVCVFAGYIPQPGNQLNSSHGCGHFAGNFWRNHEQVLRGLEGTKLDIAQQTCWWTDEVGSSDVNPLNLQVKVLRNEQKSWADLKCLELSNNHTACRPPQEFLQYIYVYLI